MGLAKCSTLTLRTVVPWHWKLCSAICINTTLTRREESLSDTSIIPAAAGLSTGRRPRSVVSYIITGARPSGRRFLTVAEIVTKFRLKLHTPNCIYSVCLCRNPHFPHSYPQELGVKRPVWRDFEGFSTDSGALHKNFPQTLVCIGRILFSFEPSM